MVDTPIPVKKSASPNWWMKGKGAGTELDPSEAYIIDTLVEAGVGGLTDAAASVSVDEDATSRSMIALLKGLKNLAIDVQTSVNKSEPTTTVTLDSITLTAANTEYSKALPANCKKLTFRTVDSTKLNAGSDVRYAFVTGKVATPTLPFQMLDGGAVYSELGLYLASATLYVAGVTAGDIVLLEMWS